MITSIDSVIERILNQRALVTQSRSLLVGISGIDGSGKVAGMAAVDAAYERAKASGFAFVTIRNTGHLGALGFFTRTLAEKGMIAQIVADLVAETANRYRKHIYDFKNVGVILVEGIFLFKHEYRSLFDLAIWINCSFPTALARALARAQEGLPPAKTIAAYETIYFPAQKIHFERDNPPATADLIVENDLYSTRRFSGASTRQRNLRSQIAHIMAN